MLKDDDVCGIVMCYLFICCWNVIIIMFGKFIMKMWGEVGLLRWTVYTF